MSYVLHMCSKCDYRNSKNSSNILLLTYLQQPCAPIFNSYLFLQMEQSMVRKHNSHSIISHSPISSSNGWLS